METFETYSRVNLRWKKNSTKDVIAEIKQIMYLEKCRWIILEKDNEERKNEIMWWVSLKNWQTIEYKTRWLIK